MTINIKNFLNDKSKLSKMGEFQNLKQIEGLEMSSVSADLYVGGRDDLSLFYFKEGANYATVNTTLGINSVQDRKYRGFKREQQYFDQVRKEFIDKKSSLMEMVASFESEFSDPKEYKNMFDFMGDFYETMEDDSKFQKSIVDESRTK